MYGSLLSILLVFICASECFIPTTRLILSFGYPAEEHFANTTDGWTLTLVRIPLKDNTAPKGIVFIQHGLLDSSSGVCLNGPGESLPFILHDNGYEVWLGNNRGNGNSMTNAQYVPSQAGFWNFSWDDMAKYDLPAQINYALKYTGAKSLSYIGHSQGTVQAFSGFLDPAFDVSTVNLFVALAPVTFVANMQSPVFVALGALDIDGLFQALGIQEFDLPEAINQFTPTICLISAEICDFFIEAIAGASDNLNISKFSYYLQYLPGATSVKNMAHWAQGFRSKTFAQYDYGSTSANTAAYGIPTPPQYNLKNFPTQIPLALFTGKKDVLGDPADVQLLLSQLPVAPYIHDEPTYAHIDFIWATNAAQLIYPDVLRLLKTYAVPLTPPGSNNQILSGIQDNASGATTNGLASIAVPILALLLMTV